MIEPFDLGGGRPLLPQAVPYHLPTELLVLQKYFRVSRLKKHQTHFLQLPVGGQEIFDRSRRHYGRLLQRIVVDARRDRRKRNRGEVLFDRQRQRVVITVGEQLGFL